MRGRGRYTGRLVERRQLGTMSDNDSSARPEADAAGGGLLNEDWLATIVGLALLALALLGLVPDAVLW